MNPYIDDDLQTLATNITEPGRLADFIASSMTTIGTPVKQEVLETLDIRTRMDNLNRILIKELEVLEVLLRLRPKLVAFTHVSNTLGTINPVAEMTAKAHAVGALVLVDTASHATAGAALVRA